MKLLGSGSTKESAVLTIKQYSDLHGELPSTLILTVLFFPKKFNAWGLFFEDRIKVSLPCSNPASELFSEWIKGHGKIIPVGIRFDQEEIGDYDLFSLEDSHVVFETSTIKSIGWKFDVRPINYSDNSGINPDAKRKTASSKVPK